MTPDPVVTAIDESDHSKGYEFDDGEDYEIYPGNWYKDAGEFYEEFIPAWIPFFEGFKIQIVEDKDPITGEKNACYMKAVYLANFLTVVLAANTLNALV